MKRILLLLGVVTAALVGYGALSLEPAEAGCGEGSGCGMSHSSKQQSAAPAAKAGKYTCSMHPEVVSDTPGKCPKCGMNLEKVQGSAGNQSDMTGNVAEQCQQMVEEFTALEDHFDMMMKLTDIDDLAQAMVEHRDMMGQVSGTLATHERQCRRIFGNPEDKSSSISGHSGHDH